MKQEELDDYLGDLDNIHNPQEVPEGFGGRANLPDSTYQVKLERIYIDKSKKSGRLQTIIKFVILSGGNKDRYITKYCGMETAQNLDYLTADLKKLGIKEQFTWKNLYTKFNKLLDRFYEVTLQTKNGFQSVYINKEIELEVKQDNKPFIKENINKDDDIPF